MRRLLACCVCLVLAGCYLGSEAPDDAKDQSRPQARAESFHPRLLEIARTYESYSVVDGNYRWAPRFCQPGGQPPPPTTEPDEITPIVVPGTVPLWFSSTADPATHGRKMYTLFVKEWQPQTSYVQAGQSSPVGQVIVKEAWAPEEVQAENKAASRVRRNLAGREEWFYPYVRRGGKTYRASEKAALFIMLKLDPATPDTDEGWVYGTVTADGQNVTAAGRVEACMKCHQKAPYDRLFGLPQY
jgi:hypothetical protein